MRISRKVEYASRVLAQLARCHGTGKMPHIEELAQIEDVPTNYLVQILNELRNAGLIESRRGKQGGYMLARTPEEISLADIIRSIDGELLGGTLEAAGESGKGVASVMKSLAEDFEKASSAYTLRDILHVGSAEMYFI